MWVKQHHCTCVHVLCILSEFQPKIGTHQQFSTYWYIQHIVFTVSCTGYTLYEVRTAVVLDSLRYSRMYKFMHDTQMRVFAALEVRGLSALGGLFTDARWAFTFQFASPATVPACLDLYRRPHGNMSNRQNVGPPVSFTA